MKRCYFQFNATRVGLQLQQRRVTFAVPHADYNLNNKWETLLTQCILCSLYFAFRFRILRPTICNWYHADKLTTTASNSQCVNIKLGYP